MLLTEAVSAAKQAARGLARAMALLMAVGVCALVALGFLTAAAYLAAADAFGPVAAAASVAGFYALVAVGLALALARPSASRRDAAPDRAPLSDAEAIARVTDAFFAGFRAGRGSGK